MSSQKKKIRAKTNRLRAYARTHSQNTQYEKSSPFFLPPFMCRFVCVFASALLLLLLFSCLFHAYLFACLQFIFLKRDLFSFGDLSLYIQLNIYINQIHKIKTKNQNCVFVCENVWIVFHRNLFFSFFFFLIETIFVSCCFFFFINVIRSFYLR